MAMRCCVFGRKNASWINAFIEKENTMNQTDPIVIVGAKRTPMGSMLGSLAMLTAAELGGYAIKAALKQSGVAADNISEVLMGCVLPAGQGQAPARQAAINAGIPHAVGATTINKMCGSGMKTIMLAHDLLCCDGNKAMVAGGLESMSNAPYLLDKARSGYRLGHGKILDHMFLDGLEDAYNKGQLMGCFADATADKYGFSRAAQDAFAIESLTRAQTAAEDGSFLNEIVPLKITHRKGTDDVTSDDGPKNAKIDKIPQLKPAFSPEGTVTAANASSISDGAAALVLMRRTQAIKLGLRPLAKIVGHASFAQAPEWFTTAPVGAIKKLLGNIGWHINNVDLFEINEAFACVTMAAMHDLDIPHDKVNIHGGACALGHPIGASGARIIVTLINALQKYDLKKGVASLCIGGGEATAMAIEIEN